MRRSTSLTATALVTGATLATAGVTVALSVLGSALLANNTAVLSSAQVRSQLAAAGPARPGAGPAPGRRVAAPVGSWTARNLSGGTVFAACVHDQATLTDWIPAQGYQTAGFAAGPASAASVRFESAAAVLVVTVTCHDGRPAFLPSANAPHAVASATPPVQPGRAATTAPATTRPATGPATTGPPDEPGQGGKGPGGSGRGGPGGSGGGGGGDG
jgi:hypothetical protein